MSEVGWCDKQNMDRNKKCIGIFTNFLIREKAKRIKGSGKT